LFAPGILEQKETKSTKNTPSRLASDVSQSQMLLRCLRSLLFTPVCTGLLEIDGRLGRPRLSTFYSLLSSEARHFDERELAEAQDLLE
jgi:hypothetical protein